MKKNHFPPEFKTDAVRRVVETHRPVKVVARELGIGVGPLSVWVRRYREQRRKSLSLERNLRSLAFERDVLKTFAVKLLDESALAGGSNEKSAPRPLFFS